MRQRSLRRGGVRRACAPATCTTGTSIRSGSSTALVILPYRSASGATGASGDAGIGSRDASHAATSWPSAASALSRAEGQLRRRSGAAVLQVGDVARVAGHLPGEFPHADTARRH